MAFRDGPFENIKVPLAWTAAVVVVVAVIGAIVLLLGDRTTSEGGSTMGVARGGFEAAAGPVGGVFAAPVRWAGAARDYVGGYFFAIGENRRLKAEIAELSGWRDEAIAQKNINGRYEAMLGIRPEPPIAMQTARSIMDSRGPFSNARLIDAGSGWEPARRDADQVGAGPPEPGSGPTRPARPPADSFAVPPGPARPCTLGG